MQQPTRRYNPKKTKTLWTTKPWQGRLGTYIGIRWETGQVWVAIRAQNHPKWIRSRDALAEDEAQDWAKSNRWR